MDFDTSRISRTAKEILTFSQHTNVPEVTEVNNLNQNRNLAPSYGTNDFVILNLHEFTRRQTKQAISLEIDRSLEVLIIQYSHQLPNVFAQRRAPAGNARWSTSAGAES
ncbi:hypothetical protein [Massilia eburnea]|uniref:hypothetical protein n=1 Tax=Massilia eburnea TaxID=1776165 RepID=UPI00147949DF|nr:hypothetical protein [Massilia eburnea]